MTLAQARLKLPLKLSYGLGWSVEGIVLMSFELFILFYYTQVVGLSGTLTGMALFVAMAADGVADPVIGRLSDDLRGAKWGRRHTPMLLAAIPLAIAFILLFLPPVGMGQAGIFAWLTVTAIATRLTSGIFIIPYSALNAELTRDSGARASLGIYKSVIQTGMVLLLITSSFQFFFAASPGFSHGQSNPAAYPPFAFTWAAVLVVVILVTCAGTYGFMRRIEAQSTEEPVNRFSLASVMEGWSHALVRNHNVRWIILGALASTLTSGMVRALSSHMAIYFWALTPQQITLWQQAAIPGMIAGMFLAKALLKRVESLTLIMVGMALTYVAYTMPPALRLAGVLPPNGTTALFHFVMASAVVSGVGAGFLSLMSGLICAEASDEDEWSYGAGRQGLLFGFIFLSVKVGSAAGKLLSGIALDVVGFPAGKTVGSIGAKPINDLGLAQIVIVLIFGSLSFLFWSRYRLRRDVHSSIVSALAERRAAVRTTGLEGALPPGGLAGQAM